MTVSSHPSEKPAAEDFSVTWHALSAEEVLSSLGTQIEQGLTAEEAEKRQAQYGLNQLVEAPRTTFLKMVIDQLNKDPRISDQGI